ncbi:MAG TPA: hypothetical protein VIY73_18465 [Polyangiaceae bacterium]
MRSRRPFIFVSIATLVAACGSRTGLLVPLPEEDAAPGVDALAEDATREADAAADTFVRDVTVEDSPLDRFVEEDALPPLDVRPPPPDAFSSCPDAGSTYIYVITQTNNLYSFYPPTAAFTLIGTIACPTTIAGENPFSMGVDRKGIAYIVFSARDATGNEIGGELFRVSTATAACLPTGFTIGQQGFARTFGMGFSADQSDAGESLYVASDDINTPQLGRIDVSNFALHVVGDFNPPITQSELTGTGAGGLFGFWEPTGALDSQIVQIDKQTALVTNANTLSGLQQNNGWAFAFWGGSFYMFTGATAGGSTSVVTRYDPGPNTLTQVGGLDDLIVGAGVSTCAPSQ